MEPRSGTPNRHRRVVHTPVARGGLVYRVVPDKPPSYGVRGGSAPVPPSPRHGAPPPADRYGEATPQNGVRPTTPITCGGAGAMSPRKDSEFSPHRLHAFQLRQAEMSYRMTDSKRRQRIQRDSQHATTLMYQKIR